MAEKKNHETSAGRPNVSQNQPKPFLRSRLYLQLLTIFAVVLAFCLGISIFFKVETITVSGAERYSAWTVAEASGIQEGDNLLFFGRGGAAGKIKLALPYVKDVRIGIQLPGTVNIIIEEVPVVYSVKAQDGTWWLMTADGKLTEKTTIASAGECTSISGIFLDAPEVGKQAVAWEEPPATDENGAVIPSALTNADKLRAALQIFEQLERNEILGEAASVNVSNTQDLRLWYGERFEVLLGNTDNMAEKIATMKSAVKQMGNYQTGILEIVQSDGIWQVVYRQTGS